MRAVLTNFGSTGSVLPYLSLGIELQRRGHVPLLALSPYFQELVVQSGLQFAPVGPDLRRVQTDINESMMAMPDSVDRLKSLLSPLAAALPEMYRDLRQLCSNADVLISGPVQPVGLMVHETLGIPLVTVQNVHFASGGSPAFTTALAETLNPFRKQLGVPVVDDPIMSANRANLVLFAMSRHVRPPLPNWPAHYHMPGYFFWDEACQPIPALEDFLSSGPVPVVITFGSMTHEDPRAMTQLLLEAIDRVGCRAIIQHGWSGLANEDLPDNVCAIGFVPHHWLFPRASVIVHHGGSGTTASAFRAGVPSVFVPHTWEQPVWAHIAKDLGCSGGMIPLSELRAHDLANAMQFALEDAGCREAAVSLGKKIRSEAGVRQAGSLINQLASQLGVGCARAF